MNNKNLKFRNYIYFSALHLSEKVTKNDLKFKAISLITNMIFIFCLGICIIIFGMIDRVYNVDINVNDNIIGYFFGLVFLALLINQLISKIYETYVRLPVEELLTIKKTINNVVLNWLFPMMAILSIVVLSISIIIGDLIKV